MLVYENILFADKKEKAITAVLSVLYVFLYSITLMLIVWILGVFPNINIDQVIFTAMTPIDGTTGTIMLSFYIKVIAVPVLFSLITLILILKEKKAVLKLKNGKTFKLVPILCKHPVIYFSILIFFIGIYSQYKLEYIQYIYYIMQPSSTLYEKNYINPAKVKFTFPEKKRNLIILYMESMEITATSKEYGGLLKNNLIPELTELAENELSFSNGEKLGGATQTAGATHSIASLVCLNMGIPLILQIPPIGSIGPFEDYKINFSKFKINNFITGGYGLGDLLYDNGYNLVFSMASDKEFGCLGQFLENHKNFKVKTSYEYKQEGRLPKDYNVWWGFEDEKLYRFAREDISALAKEDKPFAYIFFTADTHSPSGYKDEKCPDTYFEKIHNVYAGASKKAYDFIQWAKTQDFYKNTTIVIAGDHLYMGGDLYPITVKLEERHTYNVFINSAKTSNKNKNRLFATFDLFPTIVESMGIGFNAKGLGLGISLFSGEKTLLEKKGLKRLNAEIKRKSDFYEKYLMKKENGK
ncbi:LTA synthase family protein [Treponema pedis]|uniref:LTA synthase family protein n=2 Tax=Treponema pedis TaxID=409322 RepID=UPI003D1E3FFF